MRLERAATNVGTAAVLLSLVACQFGKQRRFLRAAHRDRRPGTGELLENLGLRAAQISSRNDVRALAAALNRARIERHRVFARARNYGPLFGHASNVV